MGIAKLGHLSTDGTRTKANVSNNYTLNKAELEAIREIIECRIAIDEEEDKLYGDKRGDKLPPELNTLQKIRAKISFDNGYFCEPAILGDERVRRLYP